MTTFATNDGQLMHRPLLETLDKDELDVTWKSLFTRLKSSSEQGGKLIDQIITLLENFKYQADKCKKLGYCDYGMAYVSFNLGYSLFKSSIDLSQPKFKGFSEQIRSAFEDQRERYNALCMNIKRSGKLNLNDPLVKRLNNLKATFMVEDSAGYKFSDCISVQSLNFLIRQDSSKILLIDFRSRSEFSYSHINYLNVLNVEPSQIRALFEKNPNATDSDLEGLLKDLLNSETLKMFRDRSKFDLVVLYNLRYGGTATDRFSSLEQLLVNGDKNGLPCANPFLKLIDLLMFQTRYLSSALKQYPVYLGGGMQKWYQCFGEESLTSVSTRDSSAEEAIPPGLSAPESLPNEEPGSYTKSGYLRSFNDYLTSAKTRSKDCLSVTPKNPATRARLDPSANHKTTHSAIKTAAVKITSPSQYGGVENGTKYSTKRQQGPPIRDSQAKVLKQFATGLTNLGNSCYMNCIIQSLAATPQLTEFFFLPNGELSITAATEYKKHININNPLGTKGIITSNFVELLKNMIYNSGKYFSPKLFKKIMGSLSPGQQFENSEQQDCVEFLNFILDSLHEDLNQRAVNSAEERALIMELSPQQEKARELLPIRLALTIEWERYLKINFSVIVDFFQGQYFSQLKCLVCGLTSTTYNTFSVLSLPIPTTSGKFLGNFLLSQCLDKFTETEFLDDENKWHCPRCKMFTKLTKKLSITRLPSALIIHFKRFSYETTGNFKKLDTFIKYPVDEVLDLTSYWPPVGTYANVGQSGHISLENEQQILTSMPTRNQKPPFRYRLYSVVNHFGNLSTGHYTSYVRKMTKGGSTNNWCYFDDAKVACDCDKSVVLTKNAYCLFYQRID